MQLLKFPLEGIDIRGRELRFAEAAGRSGVSAERRKLI
jgi:hypothetical protein